MILAVVRVSSVQCEVDAADECHAVVDDDRLLVMAVHEPNAGVELAADPVSPVEPLDHLPHLATRGAEDRNRGAAPDENADVDPLGQLREQISHDRGLVSARELELRREEAAGDMDVRLRLRQLVGDHRQECGPVDEDFDLVARPHRELATGPLAAVRFERALPADLAQASRVVRRHGAVDGVSEGVTCGVSDLPPEAICGSCRLLERGPRAHESLPQIVVLTVQSYD